MNDKIHYQIWPLVYRLEPQAVGHCSKRRVPSFCARAPARVFVHQFAVIAKPQPKKQKRKGGQGKGDGWKPRMWRPTPIKQPKPGLAAVTHAQALAARDALSGQYAKAQSALASV
jgi:hypothetical protein